MTSTPALRQRAGRRRFRRQPPPVPNWIQFTAILLCVLQAFHGYAPPVGAPMNFTVDYHQRLANQPGTFNCSNVGPQWQFSWLSSISGGPTNGLANAVHDAPDGSQYTY